MPEGKIRYGMSGNIERKKVTIKNFLILFCLFIFMKMSTKLCKVEILNWKIK